MAQAVKQTRPFGIRDKIAYAAGDLGCNMSFALKGTLTLFWTIYMGLDATWVFPLLMIIVNIWDAINDPLIGGMIDSDRRNYKLGKFKTYIFIGSIGLLIAGALCFLPFPKADDWVKIVLFIAGYILWDAFYTVANVPYGSMMSLISEDPGDRAQLSAWRSIGSILGNMLPMVLLPFLIYTTDASGNKILAGERVFFAALIMGILGFIFFQFMIRTTTLRVDENMVKVKEDAPKFNIFKAMLNFLKNRAAVGATIAAMAMFIGMQGTTTAVNILFLIYFKNPEISGLISMFSIIPMFVFMPFIRKVVAKWGKQEACVVASLVSIVGAALLLILPITPDLTGIIMYMISMFIYGVGLSVYTAVSWSLMADAIDYNEWKHGTREEGTVYSLHSFFRKLAQGVGPALVLSLMGLVGFNSELGEAQTFETASNIRWLVAVLFLVSAALMFVGVGVVYNLNKKKLDVMTAEIAARRATETVATVDGEAEEAVVEAPETVAEELVDAAEIATEETKNE